MSWTKWVDNSLVSVTAEALDYNLQMQISGSPGIIGYSSVPCQSTNNVRRTHRI